MTLPQPIGFVANHKWDYHKLFAISRFPNIAQEDIRNDILLNELMPQYAVVGVVKAATEFCLSQEKKSWSFQHHVKLCAM